MRAHLFCCRPLPRRRAAGWSLPPLALQLHDSWQPAAGRPAQPTGARQKRCCQRGHGHSKNYMHENLAGFFSDRQEAGAYTLSEAQQESSINDHSHRLFM
eukprot:1160922-Pelagomonas_calceolata.AAC.9